MEVWTHLDACQGLQGAFEVAWGDGGGVQDVRVAEPVSLVEQQQDDHLVRADVQLMPLLAKLGVHVIKALKLMLPTDI